MSDAYGRDRPRTEGDAERLIARLVRALHMERDGYEDPSFSWNGSLSVCPECGETASRHTPAQLIHAADCPHTYVPTALEAGEQYLMNDRDERSA